MMNALFYATHTTFSCSISASQQHINPDNKLDIVNTLHGHGHGRRAIQGTASADMRNTRGAVKYNFGVREV